MKEKFKLKPCFKLVPFEFKDSELLRNKWIKFKGDNNTTEYLINTICDNGVYILNTFISYEELFTTYEFVNGEYCGKNKQKINKSYELIKEYPGSPKLGTIVYHYRDNIYSENKLISDGIKDVDKYPEFWEEVIKKDYEILEIVNIGEYIPDSQYSGDLTTPLFTIFKLNRSKSKFSSFYCSSPINYDTNIFRIWKIKRLSDGETFTVGDRINVIVNNDYNEEIISINLNKFHTKDITLKTKRGGVALSFAVKV